MSEEASFSDLSVSGFIEPPRRVSRWARFQARLLGYLLALSVFTSLAAGGVYYSRQVKYVQAEQAERGRTLIGNLAGQSELGAYSGDPGFLAAPLRRAFLEHDVSFAAVYDRQGGLLLHLVKPEVKVDLALPSTLLSALQKDPARAPLRLQQAEFEDLVAPVVSVQGDPEEELFGTAAGARPIITIGVARLGLSLRPAQAKLDDVLRWGIYLTLMVLAMGTTAALILARRVSRPILALARGADKIRAGKLGYQLHLKRSDELGLLAESFNRMSAKLCETVQSLEHLNRHLEAEVSRRTQTLQRSRDFVTLLNAPLQLERLLDSALDALLSHSDAQAGAIFQCDRDGNHKLLASQGAPANVFTAAGSLEPVQEVERTRRPRLVDPLPEQSLLRAHVPGARVLVCMPVEYRERLEAVLVLALGAPPLPDLLDFIEHATSQLAIAVSNARAYAATEQLARELERRNLALLQQRDQLQEMSRIKSEFVANISHELRTPLNAIIGYTELLADGVYGSLSDRAQQSLADITESAFNLQSLIDQILDLSKVEAGKMTVVLDEVDLKRLVQDVVDFSAPLCKDRPYAVAAELPVEPLLVRTDPAKVRQILVNLIGNAIKFTERGTVTVVLDGQESGDVTISVRDTGIGIHPEHLQFIFDEFRQVDGSSTRKHGGTGLGLAISKKFATLLGGDITVESRQGQGSCFTLVLPRTHVLPSGGPATAIGEIDASS